MAAVNSKTNKTQRTAQGLTAMEKLLFDSAQQGNLELVKKILDKGASVNATDEVRVHSR